ncbi:AAEL003523-PA [Aedes aegypti]|uniref:AAEL003523-PA n=1 Tax=Aedes aegypti TaxID=7159 RepID=Q0IG56_AEDAE|nr:AAEL003523-PA [Aedes aegypti]
MKRSGACIRTQCDHFPAGKKSVENNQLVNYIGVNRTFGSKLNYKNVAYLPNKFCPGYFQLISETGTRWRSLIDLNFGIDLSGVYR